MKILVRLFLLFSLLLVFDTIHSQSYTGLYEDPFGYGDYTGGGIDDPIDYNDYDFDYDLDYDFGIDYTDLTFYTDKGCCYRCVNGEIVESIPNTTAGECGMKNGFMVTGEPQWKWVEGDMFCTQGILDPSSICGGETPWYESEDYFNFYLDYEEEEEEDYEEEKLGCCFKCALDEIGGTVMIIDSLESQKKKSDCKAGWTWEENGSNGYCKVTYKHFSIYCPPPPDPEEDANDDEVDNRSSKLSKGDLSISVFPTANSGSFIVELNQSNSSNILIQVMDIEGKIVYSHNSVAIKGRYQHNVDLQHSSLKGLYIVKTNVANEVYVNRVFIAK